DVLREQADAAAGDGAADGVLVRIAVDAIERVHIALVDVEGARAHRIVGTGRHALAIDLEFRMPGDHVRGRRPGRPFPLVGDVGATGPLEAGGADTDAVAHGHAVVADVVEEAVGGVDDHRAGGFPGRIDDLLAPVPLRHQL